MQTQGGQRQSRGPGSDMGWQSYKHMPEIHGRVDGKAIVKVIKSTGIKDAIIMIIDPMDETIGSIFFPAGKIP